MSDPKVMRDIAAQMIQGTWPRTQNNVDILERHIEQLGQQENYIIALLGVCGVSLYERNELPLTTSWKVKRATPEQCAQAFERVMESL
jgi:hypothetical protein